MRVLVALCVSLLVAGTLAAPPLLGSSRIAKEIIPALSALELEADGSLPVCLFVHGLGQSPDKDVLLPQFPIKDYWGAKIQEKIGSMCTPMYVHYNSQSRAWHDKGLQQTVCNLINQSKARIVFSHSMGNNVIGHAIFNKIPGCNFVPYSEGAVVPAGQRAWVSLQGVFGGSTASDFCVKMCASKFGDGFDDLIKEFKWDSIKATLRNGATDLVSLVPKAKKACVCNNGRAGPAIESCSWNRTNIKDWTDLQTTARLYAWRATCGLGPWPVALKWVQSLFMPIPYFLLEAFQGYGKDFITRTTSPMTGTDGFVTWTSCRSGRPDQVWNPVPSARFYVGRMNHADGTGRTGDGKDPDQKPLSFMVESVKFILPRLK